MGVIYRVRKGGSVAECWYTGERVVVRVTKGSDVRMFYSKVDYRPLHYLAWLLRDG